RETEAQLSESVFDTSGEPSCIRGSQGDETRRDTSLQLFLVTEILPAPGALVICESPIKLFVESRVIHAQLGRFFGERIEQQLDDFKPLILRKVQHTCTQF